MAMVVAAEKVAATVATAGKVAATVAAAKKVAATVPASEKMVTSRTSIKCHEVARMGIAQKKGGAVRGGIAGGGRRDRQAKLALLF